MMLFEKKESLINLFVFLLKPLRFLFPVFNPFYREKIYRWYLEKTSKETKAQLFLITRGDFGTFLLSLYYAYLFKNERSKISILVLTSHYPVILTLAQFFHLDKDIILYQSYFFKIYCRLFGKKNIHYQVFAPIFAKLACSYPNAIFLYEQSLKPNDPHRSNYISYLDPYLKSSVDPEFRNAYLALREIYDCRTHFYQDLIHLHYNQFSCHPKPKTQVKTSTIFSKLNIQAPYVILNINCKEYFKDASSPIAGRRRIQYPERYNILIDYLIEKGFTVVIQGRNEQPTFLSRPQLIDYSKSGLCSLENDLNLYSKCYFTISSKSGPENFSLITDTPVLGLNYVELFSMSPHVKSRFFPKHVYNKKQSSYLSWKELLSSSCFFDLGTHYFNSDVIYEDLKEEEMLAALDEFLRIVDKPDKIWLDYTPRQQMFKDSLLPIHIDLFQIKSVPCEVYLQATSS